MTMDRIPFAATLDWHEGETLYGWCARTHLGFGTSDRKSGAALFGREEAFKEHEIPRGLTALASRTHGRIGLAEDILRRRTVLAGYLPFLKPLDEKTLVSRMATSTRRQPLAINGLHPAAAAALHSLRFCRACAAATEDTQGFATWMLTAQLPGVWTCPVHDCALVHVTGRPGGWALPDVKGSYPVVARSTADVKTLQPLTQLALAVVGKTVDTQLLRRRLAALANEEFPGVLRDPIAQARMHRAWTESKLARCLQREHALQPLVLDPQWMMVVLTRSLPVHPFQWMTCWALLTAHWAPSVAVSWFLACDQLTQRAQQELWAHDKEPLPLPCEVEAALATSSTKADLARALNVGRRRLDQWLRDTPALTDRWTELQSSARLKLAVSRCEQWLIEHPAGGLSDFCIGCATDVEWLARFPVDLNGLLKRVPNRRGQQKFLPGFRPPEGRNAFPSP